MLHACFVRSPFARARIVGDRRIGRARARRACTPCSPPPTSTPTCVDPWYSITGKDVPDSPRPPLAEGEVRFVGDPVALVDRREPLPGRGRGRPRRRRLRPAPRAGRLRRPRSGRPSSCTRASRATSAASCAGAGRRRRRWTRRAPSAAHVVTETIHEQAYAAVPMETRGPGRRVVRRASSRSGPAPRRPHEMRAFCARLLGHRRSTASG